MNGLIIDVSLAFKHTDQEIIDFSARNPALSIPNVPKLDYSRAVDGERKVIFLKPLPPSSEARDFELRTKVLGVYDKGDAGSVVETETILAEKNGDHFSKVIGSAFFIGQGNWDGPKGAI